LVGQVVLGLAVVVAALGVLAALLPQMVQAVAVAQVVLEELAQRLLILIQVEVEEQAGLVA
jgi:hypothetical protein